MGLVTCRVHLFVIKLVGVPSFDAPGPLFSQLGVLWSHSMMSQKWGGKWFNENYLTITSSSGLNEYSHQSLPPSRATVRRPRLIFTVPTPSMSQKLNLTCLAWPQHIEPDEYTIQVKLDRNETVSFLKKLIKNEYARRFAHVDASDLVLWKCSIPIDHNLTRNLSNIRFDGTDSSVQRIRPAASEISEYFPFLSVPYNTIQILVKDRHAW